MNILKKIELIIQELGYDYVLESNGDIIVKNPPVSFRDGNTYIQIVGGVCPITPNLVPDINRANRYFERRNITFQYGEWIMIKNNNRLLAQRIPANDFNSLSKSDAKEVIIGFITEFSKENDAVMLDLLVGNI